ncbi:hypothetical protein [Lacinutrix jangbogonensis]|uniref:hypothetical protein n=1 Tax=Lacinutrix jangbogonensis TaxID=1469557 RepID=UPI00053D80C6|nr:hypothetical protein [Lacinutrix jangbogonensis]
MKIKHIAALLVLALLFGCKTEGEKIEKNSSEIEDISLLDTVQLKMNHGEKWVANKETHIGMKRIDSILKNNASIDGKALGNLLSTQTSYIIKSCNMKGEAHDQLHIVLVPILDEISNLKDAKNNTNIKLYTKKLEGLTKDYFSYFKL